MRVNNGSAVKGSSTTRKTRGNYRFEISEDLLNAHPVGSSQEDDDQLTTLSYDQIGRNVNDLRNGRSVTPTPTLYSGRSSVQTRTSLHSDNTRASTTMSTRSSMRRRETFSVANEPHPYGLESRGLITSTRIEEEERQEEHQSNNTNSTSSTASESIFRRFISSVCKYVYLFIVGVFLLEKWCLHVKRKEEENIHHNHHVEDQNIEHHRQMSSCSGGGMNGGSVVGGGGGGFGTYETSSEHEQHEFENQGYIISSTQRIIRTTRTFVTNMLNTSTGSNLADLTEDEDSLHERSLNQNHHHHQRVEDNYGEMNTQDENSGVGLFTSLKEFFGSFWELFRILLRLLLVILALLLLWTYWDYVALSAGTATEKFAGGVGSALSLASSGLTTIFTFLTSLNFAMLRPAQQFNSPNPSSLRTDSGRSSSVANEPIIIQKDSEVTLAALKAIRIEIDAIKLQIAEMKGTQETFEALKERIAVLEKTTVHHATRLDAHDNSFKSMEMEIQKIISAMRAASAKEKTVEQIVDEVLSAIVGETTEGKPVSLKSMFSVLAEDKDRISQNFESELRALSENIGKVQVELNGNIDNFNSDVRDMNSRVEAMKTIVHEHKTAEVEVDIEKLKTVLLPILSSEIQKSVKISCQTRNCPEVSPPPSSPLGEFSTADIELMIKRAIAKYDADKTGLPDLALESAGGSILSTRCTKSSELRNSVISYWGFRLWSPPNTPRTIIQPGVVPGECWAFEGSVGDVVIKLAVPSIVSGFTLEHIPKSVSRYGHIDSAPKHFQVLGLQSEHDVTEVHDYGSFTFDENDEPLQYFPVTNLTSRSYPIVELKVLSNHGNMRHTCIYRFRVHGVIDLTRSQMGNGGGGGKTKSSSTEEESDNNSN